MERHKATIKKLVWKEARKLALKMCPQLVKIIDALDPDDSFVLFKADYPFGRKIVDRGALQVPAPDGKVLPIDAASITGDIKQQLKRRSVPVAIILSGVGEVYYEMPERLISINIFQPGYVFGLWESLDPAMSHLVKRIWSVNSGARSLYMLPKITDITSHKELKKKYNIRSHLPKTLLDHWQIFVEIANSQAFEQEWNSEVLFFSDKWMETALTDPAWRDFHNYLLQEGWNQSQYWRNKATFDIIWELFTNTLIEQNIRPNPYFVSIIKHLVLVGTGVLPAFIPAIDNSVAPITGLQKVYMEDYKLRDYIPTIMQPHIFSCEDKYPSYYSLQLPNLLETVLSSRHVPSVLSVMPEIMFLLDTFQTEVLQGQLKAGSPPIEKFAKEVVFDFFHSEAGDSYNIRPTKDMPLEDGNLLALPSGYEDRIFVETGHFFRGCVRLSSKKNI